MNQLINLSKLTMLMLMLSLVGCTCAPLKKTDPLECFNRGVYGFNKGLDYIVLKPAARVYLKILPKPVRAMVNHFFQNLREIPTFGNDLLQCKFKDARIAATRFALNTTWGIGGLFDVAYLKGLEPHTNDFGITLAKWGFIESIYVVLPVLGPSTARDAVGAWGVTYYMSVYPYIRSERLRYTLLGIAMVDARANFIKHEGAFAEAAVDEYKLVREAYLRHREYEINGEEQPSPSVTTDTSLHQENAAASVELQGPPP